MITQFSLDPSMVHHLIKSANYNLFSWAKSVANFIVKTVTVDAGSVQGHWPFFVLLVTSNLESQKSEPGKRGHSPHVFHTNT